MPSEGHWRCSPALTYDMSFDYLDLSRNLGKLCWLRQLEVR